MSNVPLELYWNPTRGDNFSTASAQGRSDAAAADYVFVREEAKIFSTNGSGRRELKIFWNPQRGDNMTAATAAAEQDALSNGYQLIRSEGYVDENEGPGSVPLKLYFGPEREDYFLTGTPEGEAAAVEAGYEFIRVEGYGAGEVKPDPHADSIRDYIENLAPLPLIVPKAGVLGPVPGAVPGSVSEQVSGGEAVNRSAELALLNSSPSVIWPGALVAGATISDSTFTLVTIPRAPGTLRLGTDFVVQGGEALATKSRSRRLPVVTAQAVDDARDEILKSLNPRDSVGYVNYAEASGTTLREAMVKLGVAYYGGANSASVDASLKTSTEQNNYFIKYFQVYYRAAFDLDPNLPDPFFASGVTLDQVRAIAGPGNPPLYISEVAYGRILMLHFSGLMTVTDLEAVAKAAIGKAAVSTDVRFKDKVNRTTVSVWSVGATGALAATTIANIGTDSVAAVRNYITQGAQFSLSNPGAPIMFTLRYVGRGVKGVRDELAIAQMVAAEGPRILKYEITKDFQVWRGQPGGGWLDTKLDIMAGDQVRIEARGFTKTWRAFDPPVPPTGWPQSIPGALDNMFPLGNRPPHSFIARFGDDDAIGIDQTGGDRITHISSGAGPSDSFYVGRSRVIDAGAHAAGDPDGMQPPPRVYRNTGCLWLGINDSEAATHGDPGHKLNVTVHIKRT